MKKAKNSKTLSTLKPKKSKRSSGSSTKKQDSVEVVDVIPIISYFKLHLEKFRRIIIIIQQKSAFQDKALLLLMLVVVHHGFVIFLSFRKSHKPSIFKSILHFIFTLKLFFMHFYDLLQVFFSFGIVFLLGNPDIMVVFPFSPYHLTC